MCSSSRSTAACCGGEGQHGCSTQRGVTSARHGVAKHTAWPFIPRPIDADGKLLLPCPQHAATASHSTAATHHHSSAMLHFMTDFFMGGLSAALTKTAFAPIERIKLLLQTQHAHPDIIAGKHAPFYGPLSTFARVYHEQGVLSFWRGNTAAVLRSFPTQAFNFGFWGVIKRQLPQYDAKNALLTSVAVNTACGAVAGAATTLIVYPLDFARTRLAADLNTESKREFRGLVDCLYRVAARRGVGALYRGFFVSVQGIVVYRGVYFGLYDTLKARYLTTATTSTARADNGRNVQHSSHSMSSPQLVASKWAIAQGVTMAAGAVSYPFDTVRRRLIVQADTDRRLYTSAIDCWRKIFRQEGISGYFRGISLSFMNWCGAAILLVVFDELHSIWPSLSCTQRHATTD